MRLGCADAAILAWRVTPRMTPGCQARYSQTASDTAVMVRLAFHQPLRQTEGRLSALLALMGVDLPVPDHTTNSRRSARRPPVANTPLPLGPVTLVVDGQMQLPPGPAPAHAMPGRQAEAAIGVAVLNRMIDQARPNSVHAA